MMARQTKGVPHWGDRHYLITDTSISVINRELQHIEANTIHTPDTKASFEKIRETLGHLKGA
jgi:hypothetical protein